MTSFDMNDLLFETSLNEIDSGCVKQGGIFWNANKANKF